MATQIGDIKLTGTVAGICFYRMLGEYYARRKSSLSKKKFWKDKAFEQSRRSAVRFAQGNQLASLLYRQIPKPGRTYPLFCFLKTKAIALLKTGLATSEVKTELILHLVDFGLLLGVPAPSCKTANNIGTLDTGNKIEKPFVIQAGADPVDSVMNLIVLPRLNHSTFEDFTCTFARRKTGPLKRDHPHYRRSG